MATAIVAPNGMHSAFAVITLVAILSLTFRPGEPPAWLYVGIYQWLQAASSLLLSDARGEVLADEFFGAPTLEATYLTLIGVVCFCAGGRLGAWRPPLVDRKTVDASLDALMERRLVVAWAVAFAVAAFVSSVAFALPAISQLLLAFAQFHWVIVFLLAAWVVRRNNRYGVLAVVVAVEAIYGLMGYFSSFKNVFFVTGIAVLFVAWSQRWRATALIALSLPMLLTLGIFWTAIKDDYRSFLNQGTGEQVVLVTTEQRLVELVSLVGSTSAGDLADAAVKMVERIGYVTYFAAVIEYVPQVVPYQDGGLWLKAIWHVLVPRLVDQNKPMLDDSERTNEFTGMSVAGVDEGTSIGLGYVAESYIDFGPVLMFVPIFLWGLLAGAGYRWLCRDAVPILGLGCGAILIVFGAGLVETSSAKMLGGYITGLVVFALTLRFLGARALRLLSRPERGR